MARLRGWNDIPTAEPAAKNSDSGDDPLDGLPSWMDSEKEQILRKEREQSATTSDSGVPPWMEEEVRKFDAKERQGVRESAVDATVEEILFHEADLNFILDGLYDLMREYPEPETMIQLAASLRPERGNQRVKSLLTAVEDELTSIQRTLNDPDISADENRIVQGGYGVMGAQIVRLLSRVSPEDSSLIDHLRYVNVSKNPEIQKAVDEIG